MENDPNSNPFDEDTPIESVSAFDDSNLSPIEDADSGGRTFIWLLLGIIVIGCGILFAAAFIFFQPDAKSLVNRYFPSSTPTFTRTPTSTPTPNITATQRAMQSTATAGAIQTTIAEANSQWAVLLSDSFDDNKNQWDANINDDYATITRAVKDGKYKWDATAKQGFIERIISNTKSATDFSLTVEGQHTSGSSLSDFGLIFRKDSADNFYYFGVGENNFQVALNYNNAWINVVDWTSSNVIRPDGPNRLTVIAKGSHFIFLINDQVVAEATDDHISKGTTGLAIQVYEPDLKATFEFDNFELRMPKPPATPSPTPNLTATSVAEDWKIILKDNFDSNKNGWGTEASDDERAKSTIKVADGKYSWDISSHKLVITSEMVKAKSFDDFAISVDTKQIGGPDTAEYGVIFREDTDYDSYLFGITNKGEYFFILYYVDWIMLIDYTPSALIQPNEDNRITVIAEGSHFTFFINDQYVAEYTDNRIKNGNAGLFATLTRSAQQAIFEFDNLEIREP